MFLEFITDTLFIYALVIGSITIMLTFWFKKKRAK